MVSPDRETEWTNESVRRLAQDRDPVEAITHVAGTLLLSAADAGLATQPLNPFELAAWMGIGLRPRYDVRDARLVTEAARPEGGEHSKSLLDVGSIAEVASRVPLRAGGENLVIEYNPTRPRGRLRYSVAHELAHALFADAGEHTRHRTPTGAAPDELDDNWQLELLCNIAAAELLMPTTEILGVANTSTDIDFLMAQRAKFDVSTEALLRRFVHACDRPINLVALSRVHDEVDSQLRVDYVLSSRIGVPVVQRGLLLDASSTFGVPLAVGQTARGTELIRGVRRAVQTVGVAPFPGGRLPRSLALVEPIEEVEARDIRLQFVTRDFVAAVPSAATSTEQRAPRRLLAHVVSDAAHAWSRAGVAGALRRRLPDAAQAFRSWSVASDANLVLGNVHIVDVPVSGAGPMVDVASMVVQSGFGPSSSPRLSYAALGQALETIADYAVLKGLEVHVPRIGAGQAGGRWDLIEAAITRTLLDRGVKTVVYTKPSKAVRS